MHDLCRKRITWRISLFVSAIIVDQSIKFCATRNLLPSAGGFLDFTCNENIAWGIPLRGILFALLWMISITVLFLIAKNHSWNVFLLLVLAGAVSNIIDRLFFGCVVDYIAIGSFPIFNLADAMITTGLALFFIQNFNNKTKK